MGKDTSGNDAGMDSGSGLNGRNVYGDIPDNTQANDNNRRSAVNPAAQNPNEFRVSNYNPFPKGKMEDPIGKPFSKA